MTTRVLIVGVLLAGLSAPAQAAPRYFDVEGYPLPGGTECTHPLIGDFNPPEIMCWGPGKTWGCSIRVFSNTYMCKDWDNHP
jgi:hypothetical protein